MEAAFTTAFATKESLIDWTEQMTARVQQLGYESMRRKPAIQYAMAKEKLLAMSPVTVNDEQKVQALIEELRSWQYQAVAMSGTASPPHPPRWLVIMQLAITCSQA